jgi:hypothetical protein
VVTPVALPTVIFHTLWIATVLAGEEANGEEGSGDEGSDDEEYEGVEHVVCTRRWRKDFCGLGSI